MQKMKTGMMLMQKESDNLSCDVTIENMFFAYKVHNMENANHGGTDGMATCGTSSGGRGRGR